MANPIMATVRALEERLWQAQRDSNVAVLDELLADDALFTGINGVRESKASDLAQHSNGTLKISKLDLLDFALREIPNGAITSVTMAGAATIAGQPIVATLSYTRIWVEQNGRWQVVGAHMGIVPD